MNYNNFLNKNITDICSFSISKKSEQNHCAHFIGHALKIQNIGINCKNFTAIDKANKGEGYIIRVDDLFSKCTNKENVNIDKISLTKNGLIFVTISNNLNTTGSLRIGNSPYKHVGILEFNSVYHYSNSSKKVIKDSLNEFVRKFKNNYNRSNCEVVFLYGKI